MRHHTSEKARATRRILRARKAEIVSHGARKGLDSALGTCPGAPCVPVSSIRLGRLPRDPADPLARRCDVLVGNAAEDLQRRLLFESAMRVPRADLESARGVERKRDLDRGLAARPWWEVLELEIP